VFFWGSFRPINLVTVTAPVQWFLLLPSMGVQLKSHPKCAKFKGSVKKVKKMQKKAKKTRKNLEWSVFLTFFDPKKAERDSK
jgi:hypothetical protein